MNSSEARPEGLQKTFPVWVLYPLAIFLIVAPLSDVLIGLLPMHLGLLRWRIGAIGVISGTMVFPMLGIFLALAAAHMLDHPLRQRMIAGLSGLVGVVLAVCLVLLTLDSLQYRGEVQPAARRTYDFATIKGATTLLMESAIFIMASVASFRAAARHSARRPRTPQRSDSIPDRRPASSPA